MQTEISKWGNSLAVRLPKSIADELGLREGTPVEIEATETGLHLRPAGPRYSLDELLDGITPENLPDEGFDDSPRGAEIV